MGLSVVPTPATKPIFDHTFVVALARSTSQPLLFNSVAVFHESRTSLPEIAALKETNSTGNAFAASLTVQSENEVVFTVMLLEVSIFCSVPTANQWAPASLLL